LSDGLGPTVYNAPHDRDELRLQQHNIRRVRFIDAFGPGPFYVVDCDTASYIYLAIAEVMKYPIHLVEIPRHNFVRWELGRDNYVDFETMDGIPTNDAYYKSRWFIPESFVGRGGILKSMTAEETLAYHWATVAISWSWQLNVPRMLENYQKSLAIDASHAIALNNLAWFYATAPRPEWRDGAQAVTYGLKTVAVLPDGDNLDTLACAYAQSGDFQKAKDIELQAINAGYTPFGSNVAGDMALFNATPPETCNDSSFGQDPAPFRPRQTITRAPTDKDLFRLH
jgi:tetratricopeptide (TPR) repeat protein